MNSFDRIDPDHPLTEAARNVNAYAEEHGLQATIEWLGMGATASEVAYLAEQRAIRAVYAQRGVNLNPTRPVPVSLTVEEEEQVRNLIPAYLDGFAIGWEAHRLQEEE